ncbi:penicillin-binding protein 1C [Methylorubrum populi]|uniref:Penicillin-binding protein 1C n=1 Tax=Methylorubrum populi TaxID=223967 RepID=A0A160PLQ3_9HYPH|nr:penicillin-binding protein 1C [Methylorubrum populi]
MKLESPEKRGVTIPEAGRNRASRSARAPAASLSSAMTILSGAVSLAIRIKPPGGSLRKPPGAQPSMGLVGSGCGGRTARLRRQDYAGPARGADTFAFDGVGPPDS